jgi:hypothetical protein
MADPTLEFLKDLDNPSKWVCIPNVPVARPHKRGKMTITGKDLNGMAVTINNAYSKSGVPVRVTIGHIKQDPNADETDQPPLAGFARNAKVGKFGPGKVDGLLVDLYLRRGQEQILNQCPFRSMELDPSTKRIHGIALLTRDPALDLGVVKYAKDKWTVQYEFPPGGADNDKQDDVAPETADPSENPPADEEVDTAEDTGDMPGDTQETNELDDTAGAEEAGYQTFVKCMQRYIASGGMASMGPMNGGMPTAQAVPPAGEAPAAYQKPKGKVVSTAIDNTVRTLEAKVAAMQKDRDTEASKRLLDPIKGIVKFNYQRELEVLISLPDDAKRSEHVAYMAENYAELPHAKIGGPLIQTYQGNVEGMGGPVTMFDTPPHYDETIAYMKKNKVDYLDAEEKVLAIRAAKNNGVAK